MSKARTVAFAGLVACLPGLIACADTGTVTTAEQAVLNRAVMKAAAPAARIGANGVKPVSAQAVRIAGVAAVPALAVNAVNVGKAAPVDPVSDNACCVEIGTPVTPVSVNAGSMAGGTPVDPVSVSAEGVAGSAPVGSVSAKAGSVAGGAPVAPIRLAGGGYAVSADRAVAAVIAGSGTNAVSYAFVFAERGDVPLLYPEIERRRAADQTYFGYLEYEIALACKDGDVDRADGLAKEYVRKWDDIYKAGRVKRSAVGRQTPTSEKGL
ncbi:MAG: hypothetical protein WCK89_08415 [bacterium]